MCVLQNKSVFNTVKHGANQKHDFKLETERTLRELLFSEILLSTSSRLLDLNSKFWCAFMLCLRYERQPQFEVFFLILPHLIFRSLSSKAENFEVGTSDSNLLIGPELKTCDWECFSWIPLAFSSSVAAMGTVVFKGFTISSRLLTNRHSIEKAVRIDFSLPPIAFAVQNICIYSKSLGWFKLDQVSVKIFIKIAKLLFRLLLVRRDSTFVWSSLQPHSAIKQQEQWKLIGNLGVLNQNYSWI